MDAYEDELPPLPGELVEAVDELFDDLDDLRHLEDAAIRDAVVRARVHRPA